MTLDWPFSAKGKKVSIFTEKEQEILKVTYRPEDTFKNLIDHFYGVVIKKEIPLYPLAESVKNMAVIDAIFQSAIDNGKLIELN